MQSAHCGCLCIGCTLPERLALAEFITRTTRMAVVAYLILRCPLLFRPPWILPFRLEIPPRPSSRDRFESFASNPPAFASNPPGAFITRSSSRTPRHAPAPASLAIERFRIYERGLRAFMPYHVRLYNWLVLQWAGAFRNNEQHGGRYADPATNGEHRRNSHARDGRVASGHRNRPDA